MTVRGGGALEEVGSDSPGRHHPLAVRHGVEHLGHPVLRRIKLEYGGDITTSGKQTRHRLTTDRQSTGRQSIHMYSLGYL